MAFVARGLDMRTQQRKPALIVVEPDILALPAFLVVAFLTFPALLTIVLVIFFVAGITLRRGLLPIGWCGVTLVALHLAVLEP